MKTQLLHTIAFAAALLLCQWTNAAPSASTVESLTFNGQADQEQASFLIKGRLKGGAAEDETKLVHSVHAQVRVELGATNITEAIEFKTRVFQGKLKQLILAMHGEGEVAQVTGERLKDWSVRVGAKGEKFLVIRPQDVPTNAPAITNFMVTVSTKQTFDRLPFSNPLLSFTPENAVFYEGSVEIKPSDAVDYSVTNMSGLSPIASDSGERAESKKRPMRYRFSAEGYSLTLELREPDAKRITFEKFQLTGELKDRIASFVLTGEVVVRNPEGGELMMLSGDAALTSLPNVGEFNLDNGRYKMRFRKPGTYPVELHFNAKVTPRENWNVLDFDLVASSMRRVMLKGLNPDTQFEYCNSTKPQRVGSDFVTFLRPAGPLSVQWKEGRTEETGKLFYAVESTARFAVGAGLLRQAHVMDVRVMQGELTQVSFDLTGEGEVSRITGDNILGWKTEGSGSARKLIVQLNQAKKEHYTLVIQTQTPLGPFPLAVQPLRIVPSQAIRYAGHLLIANDGAVRLEVTEARGLSQISPELFPKNKELADIGCVQGGQAFAYRFSGGDFALTIQADNILPEVSVSEMLLYHLGETESAIEGEIELDIREAPLREFVLRVPTDFTVSRLNVAQLSDYNVMPDAEAGWSKLKMLFATPLSGRQVVQLRLEKNQNATAGEWNLPVLEPQNVKSVRGYVGVSAETGFRVTGGKFAGLTEIANAYFPKKVAGLQAAYRLREEAWSATMKVERLALSVQADATHLFTLSEGIAYGSSVVNYFISGAPISTLLVSVPAEYANVEFAGRDVRNWKKTTSGYEVYLHTPVFGTYTLLATYDRQFSATSNTVSFTGVRPMDAQSEQGSVFVVSEQQIQVTLATISPGLLQLDPGEISPEHRLLFDAPILAAYQYTTRPFDIQLTLKSLDLGKTVHQVVDRAALHTRVSREGEVVTTATYFLKSQGHSHLRLAVPKVAKIWETKVNGAKVVPVEDKDAMLIPLPAKADPTAILTIEIKVASKSPEKTAVRLDTPTLATPVLLTEWNISPDEKYRLEYKGGTVAPKHLPNRSGFAWVWNVITGNSRDEWQMMLWAVPVLLLLGLGLLRWATGRTAFRGTARYVLGALLGMLACIAALVCLVALLGIAVTHQLPAASGLTLTAPIQEPGQTLAVDVRNIEVENLGFPIRSVWPALLAFLFWAYLFLKTEAGLMRTAGVMFGWILLCWAALRVPNGAAAFFAIVIAFIVVHLIAPSLRGLARVPRRTVEPPATPPAAAAATALLLIGMLGFGVMSSAAVEKNTNTRRGNKTQTSAAASQRKPASPEEQTLLTLSAAGTKQPKSPFRSSEPADESVVQSLVQKARIIEGLATIDATLIWQAGEAGAKLDFLGAPAVLTKIDFPQTTLQLIEAKTNDVVVQRLTAREPGRYEIHFQYQIAIAKDVTSIVLPTPAAWVSRATFDLEKAEVDVSSTSAVSVQTTHSKAGDSDVTHAEIVLGPAANPIVAWSPRARDPRLEKPVFYGELTHLFIPTAGVIEGVHDVQVRPAQGQLVEVTFQVPVALTITDVQAEFVSSWRFDAEQRQLRVQFRTPQSKPFGLRLRSQLATTPLPYEQANGVVTLVGAAGQVGMIGVATGSEVQLDTVKHEKVSAINLEDFPGNLVAELGKQIPGLTLRRAFRYSEPDSKVIVAASAVQPDVRVETQETLSLGEDRTVLASQLAVHIARAGIFKLSFALPNDFEVESLTGAALSHWTELKAGGERIITLHLRGKTEGDQQFAISLTGPGIGKRREWQAPRLALREASKQTGQLVLVPEMGVRLHVKNPAGVSQLDPRKVGVTQKGVVAYRLLKPTWELAFDIETVEPWIQVGSLQDVTVREGQLLVAAQLDYQIENAGVKSLSLLIPAGAENVRFEGDLISDSVRTAGSNRWDGWELKLQRRVIGAYPLRVTWQFTMTNQLSSLHLIGIKARNANLQRGYLAVRAGGRLQIQFPEIPATLQRTEWQSIPASLRRGHELAESKDAFSTLETDFDLPITVSRHEIAKVLPARVERVELTSVVAESGEMLTEGRLWMRPGDKRQLHLRLPVGAEFWYAFVNGESAWPWRDKDETILLLEKNSDPNQPTTVEFFYTCPTGTKGLRGFNHQLLGPSFDLPLENITWQVYVPENWNVKDWQSSLQLRSESSGVVVPASVDVQSYLQNETARVQETSKQAEGLLNMGNEFLQKGTPQQARRAYQAAWRLSPQDAAFNEDARVQLHNLKMQQALIGLNQRRQAAFDYAEKKEGKPAAPSPFKGWQAGQAPDYTQQQAQQALEQNAAEDNAALMKVAERMIRQQDAGVGKPQSIRAALPTQGKELVFTGSLQVKEWADLQVKLDAKARHSSTWMAHLAGLLAVFVCLAILVALVRKPRSADVST